MTAHLDTGLALVSALAVGDRIAFGDDARTVVRTFPHPDGAHPDMCACDTMVGIIVLADDDGIEHAAGVYCGHAVRRLEVTP